MSIKVSIIIPVYNVAPYVEECIRSVMNQTMTEGVECIIVDDCGQDNSIDIVEKLVAEYDGKIEFRILHHEHNRGLSAARNTGIDSARGEYIGFIDSDDWIEPTMYEDLVKIMDDNSNIQFVTTPVIGELEDGNKRLHYSRTQMYPILNLCSIKQYLELLLSFMVDSFAWNKLIRREYIQHSFLEGRNCEDYLFHYYNCKRLFNDNEAYVLFFNKHYYHYRQREGSIIHTEALSPDKWYIDFFYLSKEIIEDCKSWNERLQRAQIETLWDIFNRFFYEIIGNHSMIVKHRNLFNSLKPYLKNMDKSNLIPYMQRDITIASNLPFGFEMLHYFKKIRGRISQ